MVGADAVLELCQPCPLQYPHIVPRLQAKRKYGALACMADAERSRDRWHTWHHLLKRSSSVSYDDSSDVHIRTTDLLEEIRARKVPLCSTIEDSC